MRWIFFLLLVANLVYFGWELDRETTIQRKQASALLAIPATAQQLQLINEMPSPPAPRTVEPAPEVVIDTIVASAEMADPAMVTELPEIQADVTAANIPVYSCYRYGPILDEEPATNLQNWFVQRNFVATIQAREEPGKQMYWVYLAPQQSRENAMALLKEMQSKGLDDFRLINRGDLQNAISLGLFSSREAVNNRLEELKEKGYVPVVVPYANVKKIYSLDVRITDTSAMQQELQQGYPSRYESTPLDCSQISTTEYSP